MTLKCLRYTQLSAETIILYSRVNSFMTHKNLTSLVSPLLDLKRNVRLVVLSQGADDT